MAAGSGARAGDPMDTEAGRKWDAANAERARHAPVAPTNEANPAEAKEEKPPPSDAATKKRQIQIDSTTAICMASTSRTKSLQAMTKERRYSKKYGTINLSLLDALKQQIKDDDWLVKAQSDQLATYGARLGRCSDPKVVEMIECLTDTSHSVSWLSDDFDGWNQYAVPQFNSCHDDGLGMAE